MANKPKRELPWVLPTPTPGITLAIKCLAAGNANEGQQRMALKWIVEEVCGTYDQSFRPSGDRDTVFAEGRRFVGLALVREINLPAQLLRSKENG